MAVFPLIRRGSPNPNAFSAATFPRGTAPSENTEGVYRSWLLPAETGTPSGTTTNGGITPRAATGTTMRATVPAALPSLLYGTGTYDAPNPYDSGPGAMTTRPSAVATITLRAAAGATMRPAIAAWLPAVDYDDAVAYDAPNPFDSPPGTITARP